MRAPKPLLDLALELLPDTRTERATEDARAVVSLPSNAMARAALPALEVPGPGAELGSIEAQWLLGSAADEVRDWAHEAAALFEALEGVPNAWAEVAPLTTAADAQRVLVAARVINPFRAEELVVRFYEQVLAARRAQPARVRAFFDALPADWYADSPLYYTYPHSLGVGEGQARGTLYDLARHLPYLRGLGYRNLQLLPHWTHAGGDGGYDVSDFSVAPELGGDEAFRALMDEAMRLGMRVITDFIPNHISVRHPWFQALLAGDTRKLSWFLPMNGVACVGTETDRKGKLRVLLQGASGTVSRPWAIFPHASKRNLIEVDVEGQRHSLFHSFYPFQVDLNLRNPEVLGELFGVLGRELNLGVVGKRMDAAPHWFKEEGTDFENLAGTHALQELFKAFVRHVVPGRGITVPEVGEGLQEASGYFGRKVEMLGEPCWTEGDAMFGFEWNSTLWAMLLDEDARLFWGFTERMAQLGPDTFWFNLGRHHDELRTDLMPAGVRERVEARLLARGAEVFAGRGVGGRMADFLAHDAQQIAKAFFLNALPPNGTPVTYYGDEVGAQNQPAYMAQEQVRRLPILAELGFPTEDASVALDRRDIGRGSVYAQQLARAEEEGYLPLRTVKALNTLWATRASLRRGVVLPLGETGAAVLSAVKVGRKREDTPLWALVNLTGEVQTVHVSAAELREKLLGGREGPMVLRDVLAELRDGGHVAHMSVEGEDVSFTLPPHAHLLLEATLA